MSNSRGFEMIIHAKIAEIDTSAINQVILEDTFGNRYFIDAECEGPLGLPVISLRYEAAERVMATSDNGYPGPFPGYRTK